MKPITKDEALRKATSYCARAEHCLHEVRQKLWQWRLDEAHHEEVLYYLTDNGYIDEARYAEAFARDKHRFSAWGVRRIADELRARRVPSALIRRAIASLEEEFPLEDQLTTLLERKLASIPEGLEPRKRYDRLMRHALYKGYSYDEIRDTLGRLLQDLDD